jgi:hypothetical protein
MINRASKLMQLASAKLRVEVSVELYPTRHWIAISKRLEDFQALRMTIGHILSRNTIDHDQRERRTQSS